MLISETRHTVGVNCSNRKANDEDDNDNSNRISIEPYGHNICARNARPRKWWPIKVL